MAILNSRDKIQKQYDIQNFEVKVKEERRGKALTEKGKKNKEKQTEEDKQ